MANISKINFESVSKENGCTCDKCGQWIKNIWTVTYTDGVKMNFGIDCFSKLNKAAKLNTYGTKILKKTLEKIEYWERQKKDWETGEINEENCIAWQNESTDKESAFYGVSFDEYKEWWLTVFIPARFKESQKEIDRFRKINFPR